MAHDREILREVWDGDLPVCFQLELEEVVGLQKPSEFYLMIPRLTYFPLVTDKVSYFGKEKTECLSKNDISYVNVRFLPNASQM